MTNQNRLLARVSVSFLLKVIAIAITAIVTLSVIVHLIWNSGVQTPLLEVVVHLMDLSTDRSIPTWYAAAVLLAISASAFFAWLIGRDPSMRRKHHYFWLIIAIVFLFMSVDEVAMMHERIGTVASSFLVGETTGLLNYKWVIVGIPVVVFFSLTSVPFLWSLPPKTRYTFILSGALFVMGAIGVEMFNGKHSENHGAWNNTYMLGTALEESLEMIGAGLFLVSMNLYIRKEFGVIEIRLNRSDPAAVQQAV